ncbi:DUF983 domain-containing protein [Emticicia sp. BO119]|uniref:DUF983 domain-containing protein n=1 Tax=Emticicia sp. BO119 TaxID=2757768 RepID=UPI0015F07793|nr:DUF983 domain-containing protein [Emticicia sp. BO119]MBA4851690.1 DUF983 domain-containing protein [Emticicia sp. BO119]
MNKFEATLRMKCPRCHEGEVFETKNPYNLSKMTAMHKHCPNCGLKYEREIGFFYGAMYVSYMFNIALFVIATVAYYLFFEGRVYWLWYIIGYVVLTFLLFPFLYRLSRSIWLQAFIKYEPNKTGAK